MAMLTRLRIGQVFYYTTVLPNAQHLTLTKNLRLHLASEGTDQTCFEALPHLASESFSTIQQCFHTRKESDRTLTSALGIGKLLVHTTMLPNVQHPSLTKTNVSIWHRMVPVHT